MTSLIDHSRPGYLGKLLFHAATTPDTLALHDIGTQKEWTYAQLKQEIDYHRDMLINANVENAIALVLTPCSDFIFTFLAASSLGLTSVFLSSALTSHELREQIRHSGVTHLLTSADLYKQHQELFDDRTLLLQVLLTAPDQCSRADLPPHVQVFYDYRPGPEQAPQHPLLDEPADDTVVTLAYTYKGVGKALGVEHHYQDFTRNSEHTDGYLPTWPGARYLSILPQYSIFATCTCIIVPIFYGASIYLMPGYDPGFPVFLEKYQIHCCTLVRPMLLAFKRHLEKNPGHHFDPGMMLICGGCHTEKELLDELREQTGIDIRQGYGTTELLTCLCNPRDANRNGTLGMPMSSDIKVKVVNSAGKEAGPRQTGEIWISSPAAARNFYKNTVDSSVFFHGEWFRTGDIGSRDEDGFIHFHGRAAGFTKVNGNMVDLAEVENYLSRHAWVARVKTRVDFDSLRGEYVVAQVQLRCPAPADIAQTLRDYLAFYLAKHKIPKEIRVI